MEPTQTQTETRSSSLHGAGPTRPSQSFDDHAVDQLVQQRTRIARLWAAELASLSRHEADRHGGAVLVLDEGAMAEMMRAVADFVRNESESRFNGSEAVIAPLRSLSRSFRASGGDPRELVRAFDVLARVLNSACVGWANSFIGAAYAASVVRVTGRLNRATLLMTGIAIAAFRLELHGDGSGDVATDGFTEMLIHELSSPLNAAEVAAVLLENERVTPGSRELRRLSGQIQRNLRRVRVLISDVRDLAIAQDRSEFSARTELIEQVLAEVTAEMETPARDAGVRIDVEQPVPSIRVAASPMRVVLRNLVSNAIRYADLDATVRWVRISFLPGAEPDSWTVSVSDNGVGIPIEYHERVFQRFFRVHPERADGTGLGLAIAAESARRLGGGLSLDSEPGLGSTFRLSVRSLE